MQPLSADTPKPLLPVLGKSLIEWHLENLHSAGVEDVYVVLGSQGHHIVRHVENSSVPAPRVHYVEQRQPRTRSGAWRRT